MKTLFLDLGMGVAGDMLTAALYELLDENGKKSFIDTMNSLGLEGISITAEKSIKCGVCGTHVTVNVGGHIEGEHEHELHQEHGHHHDHEHGHHHDHEHTHSHSGMHEISHIISGMPVSENVKKNALNVYNIIAEAESKVHGESVELVHFHEVGALDAVCDVTAVCFLLEMLDVDRIYATPVCTGFGKVRCAHGILPVPAPATANILTGIPCYAGNIEGEMCTPTGAALVKYFVDEFTRMPEMTFDKTGYGMGSKDFEAANCVRAILGTSGAGNDNIVELSCNVDDMTPEAVGFATQRLLEEGASDVYTIPIGMKKSRPGVMITVMCKESDTDKFVSLIFKYTTTIGIRQNMFKRYTLSRHNEQIDTAFGKVAVKISEGYGITRRKYEYDDLARIGKEHSMSPDEVARKIADE